MYDANDLLRLVKKSSKDVVNTTYPATIMFGTVESVSPLKVYVEQRFHLTGDQLIVPKHLTDYEVEVVLDDWSTEIGGTYPHNHTISENRKITIKNALKTSDKVVLIRQHGGQKFFIADKVV